MIDSNPLHYFEDLFEYNKTEQKKREYISYWISWGQKIIDEREGIVEHCYLIDSENGESKIECSKKTFDDDFNKEIKSECKKAKKAILKTIQKTIVNGGNTELFISFQENFLEKLLINSKKFYPSRTQAQESIIELQTYLGDIKTLKKVNSSSSQIFSFNFLAENRIDTLKKFYQNLVDSNIIECSKEEFINAFTGKKVEKGIKWMVKGKNGYTSKTSLFYFLDELIENNFIETSVISDLNKYVKYTFRDKDGNLLSNIKQSKATLSRNPSDSNKIDKIISTL